MMIYTISIENRLSITATGYFIELQITLFTTISFICFVQRFAFFCMIRVQAGKEQTWRRVSNMINNIVPSVAWTYFRYEKSKLNYLFTGFTENVLYCIII